LRHEGGGPSRNRPGRPRQYCYAIPAPPGRNGELANLAPTESRRRSERTKEVGLLLPRHVNRSTGNDGGWTSPSYSMPTCARCVSRRLPVTLNRQLLGWPILRTWALAAPYKARCPPARPPLWRARRLCFPRILTAVAAAAPPASTFRRRAAAPSGMSAADVASKSRI